VGRVSGEPERARITAALRAAERGTNRTSRLLAFARRQPLEPEPIDLNKTVTSLASMLRSALGGMIGVEVELAPGAPAGRRYCAPYFRLRGNHQLGARANLPPFKWCAGCALSLSGTERTGQISKALGAAERHQ